MTIYTSFIGARQYFIDGDLRTARKISGRLWGNGNYGIVKTDDGVLSILDDSYIIRVVNRRVVIPSAYKPLNSNETKTDGSHV